MSATADDSAMWNVLSDDGTTLSPATDIGDVILHLEKCSMPRDGQWVAPDEIDQCFRPCKPHVVDGIYRPVTFTLVLGPPKLPSKHLQDLKDFGYTQLQNVLPSGTIRVLKHTFQRGQHSLVTSPAFTRAVAHPVAQWLIEQYLGSDVRFGHVPAVTMCPKKDGSDKWHTDYPYHGRVKFQGPPQGLQFNICVDPFQVDNAATQFVPLSHKKGHGVPHHWNRDATRMIHEGQGVEHMLATAGSGLLYDARTWHRRCPECNRSGQNRIAVLIAVTRREHKQMSDTKPAAKEFQKSNMRGVLTRRECDVVQRLLS